MKNFYARLQTQKQKFPPGCFFFSGMGPMPRGGRAIWGATRGYRRANWTLRRPDQPYTAWHGHWFRHCPPAITGASPPLHSAILPPSPQPPLPTQSTEAPHLPSRVLGRNLGSMGALLGLRPAIERTRVRNEPRRTSPLPWPKGHGKTLFSILLMPLVMGHMAHLGMTLKAVVWAN